MILEKSPFIDKETFERLSEHVKPKKGDILYANIGSNLGSAAVVEDEDVFAIAWNVFRIRIPKNINCYYVRYFLDSKATREVAFSNVSTSTVPFVSGKKIVQISIPLPPVSEQKRIVEKVDRLMSLCDKLELRIKGNKKDSGVLMGTVLREVF